MSTRARAWFGPRLVPARRWFERLGVSSRVLAWRMRRVPAPPVAVVGAYKQNKAPYLRALLDRLPPQTPVALWAVDAIAPSLATETVGEGPGLRVDLLNRAAAHVADHPGYLILVDDDISLLHGTLLDVVKAADAAELDVSQPAQAIAGTVAIRFMRRRALSLVRRTRFVEGGPCVVLSERARKVLLPLPVDTGMGWGLEGYWGDPALGLRQGLVDALPLQHHGPIAVDYDQADHYARAEVALQRAGISSWTEWHIVDGVWRPWQSRAPWTR